MADLGGLGATEGPPANITWVLPNLLPRLLPWLALLALLALPSNRYAQAWLMWLPLAVLVAVGAALQACFDASGDDVISYYVQTASAAAFGVASVWLVAGALGRCGRVLSVLLVALAAGAVGLLAFTCSPLWEEMDGWSVASVGVFFYALLGWLVCGLVFAGATNLAGLMCRGKFSSLRVLLWLPLGLCVMWLVAAAVAGCLLKLAFGTGSTPLEWAGVAAMLGIISFVVWLPFLIISFSCAFYRARLKNLLNLPREDAPPPAPVNAPATEQSHVAP